MTDLDDFTSPVDAVRKLWELVDNSHLGLGYLKSKSIRNVEKAKSEAECDSRLRKVQTDIDVDDVKNGIKEYRDGQLSRPNYQEKIPSRIEPTMDLEALNMYELTQSSRAKQDIKEGHNLKDTLKVTEGILRSRTDEPSEKNVDEDFFTRWVDCAKKVSSKEMKSLWASALAGEIVEPGSYSLRTLETLKNLSKEEAELIAKAAQYFIGGTFYRDSVHDLSLDELLTLCELGVLSDPANIHLRSTIVLGDAPYGYHTNLQAYDKGLYITHRSMDTLSMTSIAVTTIGRELSTLAPFEINIQYLKVLGMKISQLGFDVYMGDCKLLEDGSTQIKNGEKL
ncbi:uncharacterized protein DUF2806 [Sinobacterium caligoides]|uniref:Uncharacterized protein DUF2806 n=1 Tax=Sinobacterium caligoides TaxID=933926 RepID=A0A3N2DFT5_9GAMM|nr:DUF2806 domain-containing protein [Sinobacterium caligoides]ROR98666.1 uncharacterized protein DUF2806 [Sinobacterium caligoides]